MKPEINFISLLLQLFPRLLAVGFTLTTYFLVTDCAAAPLEFVRKVGESLSFPCTNNTHHELQFLYWQKNNSFLSGFHLGREIDIKPQENTKVDKSGVVHMNNLNVAHEGKYTCHIKFTDSAEEESIDIELRVTAPYSISHLKQCDEENHKCQLTCQGHGGYPCTLMEFNVTGSNSEHRLTVIDSSKEQDPNTLLFNVSSTVMFNCTGGELKVSCSVGGTTSEVISVCGGPRSSFDSIVVFTILAAVLVVVMVAGYIARRRKKAWENKKLSNGGDLEEGTALDPKPAAS